MGYRYYDRQPASVINFPFGHGLSYTTFDVGAPSVSFDAAATAFAVNVPVTNSGAVQGGVALQLYVGRASPDMSAVTLPAAPDPSRQDTGRIQKGPACIISFRHSPSDGSRTRFCLL